MRFVHAVVTRLGENAGSNSFAVEPTLNFAAKLRVQAPGEPSSGERKNSDCSNDKQASFHASMPVFSLDRIIVTEDIAIAEAGVHRTALSRDASDHLPIWAKLTLPA